MTLPPLNHQTHAATREQSYRECETARRALATAKKSGAGPERVRRLERAYWDANQLHSVWQRADTVAALAGVWG